MKRFEYAREPMTTVAACRLLRKLGFASLAVVLVVLFAAAAPAQNDDDPPPLKTISKAEKAALASEKDRKKRTALSLELMGARLKKAEELKEQDQYRAVFFQLGVFHGLMDEALNFLNRTNMRRGKDFDSFKRFEMGLREFTPRLEIIRREAPARYEGYLKQLLKAVRETRAKAVEPLFGDGVVPDGRL